MITDLELSHKVQQLLREDEMVSISKIQRRIGIGRERAVLGFNLAINRKWGETTDDVEIIKSLIYRRRRARRLSRIGTGVADLFSRPTKRDRFVLGCMCASAIASKSDGVVDEIAKDSVKAGMKIVELVEKAVYGKPKKGKKKS